MEPGLHMHLAEGALPQYRPNGVGVVVVVVVGVGVGVVAEVVADNSRRH